MKTKLIICLLLVLMNFTVLFAQNQKDVTFEKITFTDIGTISIPSIMELQSGIYKDLSNSFSKELGLDSSGTIIYQQKGLNSFSKPANTYARVMLKETRGRNGEFKTLNTKMSLTSKQLKTLDKYTKSEMEKQFVDTNLGMKLIKWFGVSIEKLNRNNAIRISYVRQLKENPPVYVELYNIENYDRKYTFTLSYRLEDAAIWADAIATVRNSLVITNIRMPVNKLTKRKNR